MYVPAHFEEDRVSVMHAAIEGIGFGTLVTLGGEGLEASHVPMLIAPGPAPYGMLSGHLARANPQWRRMQPGVQALAMFLGPNAYISPSWYPTKQQTGEVVPTWNYLAVHAYGELVFIDDPSRLRAHVGTLTATHEASRPMPWAVTDAPPDYIEKMLAAIVGFQLVITRLEGKWKMSQNRPAPDRAGTREALAREDGVSPQAVAEIMSRYDRAPGEDG